MLFAGMRLNEALFFDGEIIIENEIGSALPKLAIGALDVWTVLRFPQGTDITGHIVRPCLTVAVIGYNVQRNVLIPVEVGASVTRDFSFL